MDVSVQVDGLRALVRDLEHAGVDVADLKAVFGRVAAEAADVGRAHTRRRSGALAGTARGNKAKNKAVVTWGTARVRYAGPAIYGWPRRGIRPSDTITRTDQVMDDRAPAMIEAGLADLIAHYGF